MLPKLSLLPVMPLLFTGLLLSDYTEVFTNVAGNAWSLRIFSSRPLSMAPEHAERECFAACFLQDATQPCHYTVATADTCHLGRIGVETSSIGVQAEARDMSIVSGEGT